MKKIIAITLLATFGFSGVVSASTALEQAKDSSQCRSVYTRWETKLSDEKEIIKSSQKAIEDMSDSKRMDRYKIISFHQDKISDAESRIETDRLNSNKSAIRCLGSDYKEVAGANIEKQPDEVELTADKRTQAISMILALKTSGEAITLEKLLPIILMLRS